ncbi:Tim44 domain-containing protein [Komagataeibacter xylinus]|uniref:Tim44 domain-containing protein n=1 Tax=Komagataeibacter xylinus TaxID=28448 RepID=A0A318PJI2_KOMXY|nr:Tim44/TimA family putative adaptor protein [Komagataeibacter xylinus]AZV39715.1 Tim44 domain-containing protein [Komagataeibacter xylinus]PYD57602.1 Tim44 domain-containing protein [Komagataeibacter xylinus]GBQ74278.1 mitochondrial import inner membrane translocase subunit Tim44 [Komagataeibacter xylinus NBRC 15237]
MNFSFGHFPLDLIVLGLVAVFLVLRLRSILGRRVGAEQAPRPVAPPPMAPTVVETAPEPPPPAVTYDIPTPDTRVGGVLARIAALQPDFTPDGFAKGTEAAFRQIVTAYAAGDLNTLRTLLTAATFTAFEAAIASRQQAGETLRSEIRDITDIAIIGADIDETTGPNPVAHVEVRIVSDQISVTLDGNGQPVAGVDAVTEFSDLWVFERILGVNGDGWRLGASRSA